MRPIDPAAGPLPEFADALRELREQAGRPSFRELARRAHYSVTTLSVACSGTVLPSLDVTMAFVRACGGPEEAWRQRWAQAAAAHQAEGREKGGPHEHTEAAEPREHTESREHAEPGPLLTARPELARHTGPVSRTWPGWAGPLLRWAGVPVLSGALALTLAGLMGAYHPAGTPAGHRPAAGLIEISRCDPPSHPIRSKRLVLSHPARLDGRRYRAGTVIGTIVLVYSPLCSEAWPHFSPAAAFYGQPATMTLRTVSIPGNALNTSPRYRTITYEDGEPMLTVTGCVDAEVIIDFGDHSPPLTAATTCYQRS